MTSSAAPEPHPLIQTPAVRVAGETGALGHKVRTDPGGTDLSGFDQLRILWRPSIAAGPPGGEPFWFQVRLGSSALPVGAPGNDWHRFLPVTGEPSWQSTQLSLGDLPAAVRGAVSDLQLICTDDRRAFTADIAAVLAVEPALPADVEQALLDRLHQTFSLSGSPVTALVHAPGTATPSTRPLILILPYMVRYAPERASPGEVAVDFVTDGYGLRPPSMPWDLHFAIEALASTRADQAALLDFVIGALPHAGALLAGGQSVSCEAVDEPDLGSGGFDVERQLVHYRVRAWRAGGPVRPIRPVETVNVDVDSR